MRPVRNSVQKSKSRRLVQGICISTFLLCLGCGATAAEPGSAREPALSVELCPMGIHATLVDACMLTFDA